MAPYDRYRTLGLSLPEAGILEITMGKEGKLAVAEMHCELAEIWRDVDADPETSVATTFSDYGQ